MRTMIQGTMEGVRSVAAAMLALATLSVQAGISRTWVGGSTAWDDTTAANWNPSGVPTNTDTVLITSNTASGLNIDYTAANLTGSGLAQLTIGNSGGGTNTLSLDGTDVLLSQKITLNDGGAFNQTGGALTNSSDDESYNFVNTGGRYNMGGGAWRQSGGSIGSRGTVNQTNGAVSMSADLVLVNGSWNVSGGSLTASRDVIIGLPWAVSPPTAATPTLNIDGGTLSVGRIFTIGGGVNNATSVVNQATGTVNIASYMILNARGTYNLSGGTLNGKIQSMAADFVFNHTGGTRNTVDESVSGTYNFSGGEWIPGDTLTVSAGGKVNWTNGTLRFSDTASTIKALNLSGTGASWNMKGTTLSLNRFGSAGANSLVVVPGATLQGYGNVWDSRFGQSSPGTFQASGRVIANGDGVERTLDVSRWNDGYLTNPTDNTTSNGWFAVNKGMLRLPVVAVAAGASTKNWGEPDTDTTLDLVNSVRIDFTGATAGSLTNQLYATNCAAVPAPASLYKPLGIWSFAGITATAAVVTFRYDDAYAAAQSIAETDLRVWRHDGAAWVDVYASRDTATNTITSQSVSWPKTTTFFAVARTTPSFEPPVIQNRPVSNLQTNGATLNGKLVSSGGNPTAVYVLWGETNGAVSGSWANSNSWNAGDWADASFPATNITLTPDRTYYYTFGAYTAFTNVLATTEASSLVTATSEVFITGAVNVQPTDPTGRVTAVDTITFTATRPATCTNEDTVVNYSLGGTATNVTDYTIAPVSGAVAIAKGQTSGSIVVTPVWKTDAQKTVILTLANGGYVIGADSSATGTLAAVSATPTTRLWVGGSGTWDDLTPGNWSPNGVPFNGDTVNITSNSAANQNVGYTSVGLSGNGLAALTIGNTGGGTNTLNLDGSDLLPTLLFTLNPGGAVNMTGGTLGPTSYVAGAGSVLNGGTFTLSNGLLRVRVQNNGLQVGPAAATGLATFNVLGTGQIEISNGNGEQNLLIGGSATYPAVLNQSGGTVYVGYYPRIYTNGTYSLTSGTLSASREFQVFGGGSYIQSGGTAGCGGLSVSGGGSAFSLSGGSFSSGGSITLGAGATVNWTGGSFSGAIPSLWVTGPGAIWTMKGGTLGLNIGNPANGLFVTNGCTVQGYGQIKDNYAGGSGAGKLENSGRIVANGYGADNTLDLSVFVNQTPSVSQVNNALDNTTNNGWFAVDKGALRLPNLAIAGGASTRNWGEPDADTTIDLVNSARIDFTGATAGSLTGLLYAADCAAVPSGLAAPVGIWSFGGVTCTAAVVTFRYDNAAAAALGVAESDLQLWRHNGTMWVGVTAGRDDTAKTFTSASLTSWPKDTTFFAVAMVRGSVFKVR